MGRCTETKGFQEKPELRLGFFRIDAHQAENFLLQLDLMDTDTAAADFDAVER